MSNLLLSFPPLNSPFVKMYHTSAKGYTMQGVEWSFTDLPSPERQKCEILKLEQGKLSSEKWLKSR